MVGSGVVVQWCIVVVEGNRVVGVGSCVERVLGQRERVGMQVGEQCSVGCRLVLEQLDGMLCLERSWDR